MPSPDFFKEIGTYPHLKSIRTYRGWTCPSTAGWKVHSTGTNGYLSLSNLGKLPLRGKARNWGNPTTLTIIWKQGQWIASITVNCEVTRETGPGAVGVDFGVHHAVAMKLIC